MAIESHYYSPCPVMTLPGHVSTAASGTVCDQCDLPATHRVQGETDSMGCEYLHFCDEHKKQFDKEVSENPTVDKCDWCGTEAQLKPMRDQDEGMSGRVYDVCSDCRQKENDRLMSEMD